MKEKLNEQDESKILARKLRKYSKEQIIKAITERFDSYFFIEDVLSDLEHTEQKELLKKQSEAMSAEHRAAEACMDWRREMCDKYGRGGECKLMDIPDVEIQKGARLEEEWQKAQEKEQTIDKKVHKTLFQSAPNKRRK